MAGVKESFDEIDLEWMLLIIEAKELGLKKEDIRNFLNDHFMREVAVENR
ncbi:MULTISPECIES: anti-repressor SinI family protein [Bacillus]|nr:MULTISPECIES: anti-repressor SinI family protein [Bacillus]